MDNNPAGLAAIDERSREIFRRLVEHYIDSGEPVGSRTISRVLPINLSPASVRNIMADLEDSGLLYAPHTSAGRIPTETGLRFFVDALMEGGTLSADQRHNIDQQVSGLDREQRVEDVLTEATDLLSGLSKCAGVVVTPKVNLTLRHIEFVSLAPGRALVILIGEDGSVENRAIDIPPGLPISTLNRISNYLNTRFQSRTIEEVRLAVTSEIDTVRRELDTLAAEVVEAGLATWAGADDENQTLIVRGQAHLIENTTALDDLERIRRLFDDLEAKRELIQLLGLAEDGEGVRIFIGSESKLFSLSGSSLIMAPYKDTQQQVVGVLGVIGPTRMNYARIVPMVDYTAKLIGRLLT